MILMALLPKLESSSKSNNYEYLMATKESFYKSSLIIGLNP